MKVKMVAYNFKAKFAPAVTSGAQQNFPANEVRLVLIQTSVICY